MERVIDNIMHQAYDRHYVCKAFGNEGRDRENDQFTLDSPHVVNYDELLLFGETFEERKSNIKTQIQQWKATVEFKALYREYGKQLTVDAVKVKERGFNFEVEITLCG